MNRRGRSLRRRRRPRIVIIVENLPLAKDHRLRKQARTLIGNGYDVTVVCRSHPGNHDIPGVDVAEYRAPRDAVSKFGFVLEYSYSLLMATLALASIAFRSGFDVLQVCGAPDVYFPLGWVSKALGKPMVYDQRDPSPELYAARYGQTGGLVPRVLGLLEAATYRSANHVVTVNESLERLACTRGGLRPEQVTIVGNGPVLATTQRRSACTPLKRGRPYLCCWLGAMGPQDHLELAVRAVHRIVGDGGRTDCHFALIGDGEARTEAMSLARELGLEDWISFPGFLPQDDVFAYLASADVGIDPGLDDTVTPVKAIEYMAFGVPLVAFDLREVHRLAADTALYAPPGDIDRFAELINLLLDDAALRRRLGQAGRRLVEERLAWDHQEVRYLRVFARLLDQQPEEPVSAVARPPDTAARAVRGTRARGSAGVISPSSAGAGEPGP